MTLDLIPPAQVVLDLDAVTAPPLDLATTTSVLELAGTPAVLDLTPAPAHVLELAPAGVAGPAGPRGLPGGTFTHVQATPAAQWLIQPPAGIRAVPDLFLAVPFGDPTEPVYTDVAVTGATTIVTWPTPVAGRAEY